MVRNIGSLDRGARVFGALVFGVIAFAVGGLWGWIAGAVALILGVTAAVGTCPIYLGLGTSTVMRGRRRKRKR